MILEFFLNSEERCEWGEAKENKLAMTFVTAGQTRFGGVDLVS